MVKLANLKPSHHLAYFKQAVPDEAKRILYQHKVETVQQQNQAESIVPVEVYTLQTNLCIPSSSHPWGY